MKTCKTCGASVADEQKFCQLCGAKVEDEAPVTEATAPVYEEPAPAPVQEPQPQYAPQYAYAPQPQYAPQYAPAPKVKKPKDPEAAKKIMNIIKRSVIFALSIIMLLGMFLPIFKYKTEGSMSGKTVYVKLNAIDGIKAAVNSFYSYDDDEIDALMSNVYDKYEDDWEDWYDGDKTSKEAKFYKEYALVSFKSEEMPTTFAMVITALVSIAYIVMAVIFFINALFAFINAFSGKEDGTLKKCINFLSLQTALAIALAFAYRITYNKTMFGGMVAKAKVGGGAVTMIVLGVLALIGIAVLRIFFEEKIKLEVGAIIKRSLAFVFIIGIIISSVLPMFLISTKVEDGKKASAALKADVFSMAIISKEEKFELKDEYKDLDSEEKEWAAESVIGRLEWYSKNEFKKDDDGVASGSLIGLIMINGYAMTGVFSFATTAVLVTVLAACVLLWKHGYAVVTGEASKSGVKLSKVLSIIFSATVVAIVLLAMILVMSATSGLDSDYKYSAVINVGAIFLLGFSIAAAVMGVDNVKKEKPQAQPAFAYTGQYNYTTNN